VLIIFRPQLESELHTIDGCGGELRRLCWSTASVSCWGRGALLLTSRCWDTRQRERTWMLVTVQGLWEVRFFTWKFWKALLEEEPLWLLDVWQRLVPECRLRGRCHRLSERRSLWVEYDILENDHDANAKIFCGKLPHFDDVDGEPLSVTTGL